MKASVSQEKLAHGLGLVSRAVSPRSTLPVLGNILIASDEGRLQLSATNLELGITCWIPARIEQHGSTTVPARTFSDLVNTLPGGSGAAGARHPHANAQRARRHLHQRHQVHRRQRVPSAAVPGHGRRHRAERRRLPRDDPAGGLRGLRRRGAAGADGRAAAGR